MHIVLPQSDKKTSWKKTISSFYGFCLVNCTFFSTFLVLIVFFNHEVGLKVFQKLYLVSHHEQGLWNTTARGQGQPELYFPLDCNNNNIILHRFCSVFPLYEGVRSQNRLQYDVNFLLIGTLATAAITAVAVDLSCPERVNSHKLQKTNSLVFSFGFVGHLSYLSQRFINFSLL